MSGFSVGGHSIKPSIYVDMPTHASFPMARDDAGRVRPGTQGVGKSRTYLPDASRRLGRSRRPTNGSSRGTFTGASSSSGSATGHAPRPGRKFASSTTKWASSRVTKKGSSRTYTPMRNASKRGLVVNEAVAHDPSETPLGEGFQGRMALPRTHTDGPPMAHWPPATSRGASSVPDFGSRRMGTDDGFRPQTSHGLVHRDNLYTDTRLPSRGGSRGIHTPGYGSGYGPGKRATALGRPHNEGPKHWVDPTLNGATPKHTSKPKSPPNTYTAYIDNLNSAHPVDLSEEGITSSFVAHYSFSSDVDGELRTQSAPVTRAPTAVPSPRPFREDSSKSGLLPAVRASTSSMHTPGAVVSGREGVTSRTRGTAREEIKVPPPLGSFALPFGVSPTARNPVDASPVAKPSARLPEPVLIPTASAQTGSMPLCTSPISATPRTIHRPPNGTPTGISGEASPIATEAGTSPIRRSSTSVERPVNMDHARPPPHPASTSSSREPSPAPSHSSVRATVVGVNLMSGVDAVVKPAKPPRNTASRDFPPSKGPSPRARRVGTGSAPSKQADGYAGHLKVTGPSMVTGPIQPAGSLAEPWRAGAAATPSAFSGAGMLQSHTEGGRTKEPPSQSGLASLEHPMFRLPTPSSSNPPATESGIASALNAASAASHGKPPDVGASSSAPKPPTRDESSDHDPLVPSSRHLSAAQQQRGRAKHITGRPPVHPKPRPPGPNINQGHPSSRPHSPARSRDEPLDMGTPMNGWEDEFYDRDAPKLMFTETMEETPDFWETADCMPDRVSAAVARRRLWDSTAETPPDSSDADD